MFGFLRRKSLEIQTDAVFEKISLALLDDDFQLRILGPKEYTHFSSLTAIDQHYGAEGEFGTSITNPIPTNGPIGSLCYLSQLKFAGRHRILFHRIRVIDGIDIYEFVTLSGKNWGFMFIDMYHSRKSKIHPKEFVIVEEANNYAASTIIRMIFHLGFPNRKQRCPAISGCFIAQSEQYPKKWKAVSMYPPIFT